MGKELIFTFLAIYIVSKNNIQFPQQAKLFHIIIASSEAFIDQSGIFVTLN